MIMYYLFLSYQGEAAVRREGYPLRPELVESLMYMFRATGDRTYLQMGAHIITAIEYSAKTKCGYATVSVFNLCPLFQHLLSERRTSLGIMGEPLKALRDDSALRALSSLRGLMGAPEEPPLCMHLKEVRASQTADDHDQPSD